MRSTQARMPKIRAAPMAQKSGAARKASEPTAPLAAAPEGAQGQTAFQLAFFVPPHPARRDARRANTGPRLNTLFFMFILLFQCWGDVLSGCPQHNIWKNKVQ